jgi:DNA polymerase III epsilon subunit-like protein
MNAPRLSLIIPSDVPAIREQIPIAPAYGNIDPSTLVIAGDLAFIDIETTGVDPDADAIIEIGVVRFRNGVVDVFHSLVNPGFPIPPTSSAVNGITDEMVKNAPRIEELAPRIRAMVDGAYRGAHNANFEALFVDPILGEVPDPKKWVCSLRLARHLMPEAPAFGNNVLRYWLKTKPKSEGLGPHRAIDDVYVSLETVWHLYSLAQKRALSTLEQIRALCHEIIFTTTMNFGVHAGKDFKDIPSSWFRWALGLIPGKEGLTDMDDDLRASLERELAIPNRLDPAVVPADVMNYGKAHQGKPMSKVPMAYLEWMERDSPRCSPEIREGVRVELARRRAENPQPVTIPTPVPPHVDASPARSTVAKLTQSVAVATNSHVDDVQLVLDDIVKPVLAAATRRRRHAA